MQTINGDIIQVAMQHRQQKVIIVHQVNCHRVAGAGLARQIVEAFPGWLTAFQAEPIQLGKCWRWTWSASDKLGSKEVEIASLYAQENYGREPGRVYTDYNALTNSLRRLAMILARGRQPAPPILVPYGMSCGLAGGDWSQVHKLLATYLPDAILVNYQKRA